MDNGEICYVFRRLAIEAGLKIMNIYDQLIINIHNF